MLTQAIGVFIGLTILTQFFRAAAELLLGVAILAVIWLVARSCS